ncbi:hypothetical protein HJC23_010728 [Cyclotella cryptica]|uniref:C2H2-type domain-containing protein n=1 Tax=Cyclotella cryptica TaxID=29204 RepID=A0ABD3PVE2_9STRA|eukprot:CCRYP_011065-RA/>CCRYP_011065-RA protein AED:0.39 eAED:0.39 QI:103/1/1/1/0.5/0.33/3/1516/173
MGRYCSECGDWCSRSSFSRNQWIKGDGASRCKECVGSDCYSTYQCGECGRIFNNQNELNMHMQTHRPRNVACPVCGERRFRSGANAVQHVESGYCSGCLGQDNARRQIYDFARRQRGMQSFMDETPLLTYDGNTGGVPDFPYRCRECSRSFRQLSQLMQHQDQKHNNNRMLGH